MLKDMDLDGVAAQVLYPTEGLGLFALPDSELLSALFAAYTDWLAEFVSASPKRLKGVALVNVDDVQAGVKEMERAARLGLAGCAITVAPLPDRPYSSSEYEPLWAAAQDLRLPISFHAGTNRPGTGFDPTDLTDPCCIRPGVLGAFDTWVRLALGDMILSGVLERYPKLQAGSIEHDAAWIPYWLWRMDRSATDFGIAAALGDGMLPSDYCRRNVFVSFQEDVPAIELRHKIGVDNLTFGTDYPHAEGTFPKTREILVDLLAGCDEQERARIAGGNTARIYRLDLN
jgi:predicted TIM-barrel fold metal-dependent hydrolase